MSFLHFFPYTISRNRPFESDQFASRCFITVVSLVIRATEVEQTVIVALSKKNTSHGNEMLPQDTTHLIQRPCYQRGSPCQDLAGNWTAVEWSCFPFNRSGQSHLARNNERGKKRIQTKEELGRQHQGMDRSGVCQVQEGCGEQRKVEETGYEIIYGAQTTLAVKG